VGPYQCPGETHSISRAVHLARLAAEYDRCPGCPFRDDMGGIAVPPPKARAQSPLDPLVQSERVWRSSRIPGAATEVRTALEALAALLWKENPWNLPANDWDVESHRPSGPLVVLGCHQYASRFATDAIRTLARHGCRVVSVGSVNRPAFEFAVEQLKGTAGVWIPGGGSPSGVGFEVVSGGIPWSRPGRLAELARQIEAGFCRPTRIAGSVRTFDAVPSYRERLATLWLDRPPLRIAVAGLGEVTRRIWLQLGERLKIQLSVLEPGRMVDGQQTASLLRTLHDEVISKRLDCGIAVGPDERRVWIVDRREGVLTDRQVAERLASALIERSSRKSVTVVVSEEAMWTGLSTPGVRLIASGPRDEDIAEAVRRERAVLGCDGARRFWFGGESPHCDPFLVLSSLAASFAGLGGLRVGTTPSAA
jgi:phosphomannomutase